MVVTRQKNHLSCNQQVEVEDIGNSVGSNPTRLKRL